MAGEHHTHHHGNDPLSLLSDMVMMAVNRIEDVSEKADGVVERFEDARREDNNRIHDKLERGFERVHATIDSRFRDLRLELRAEVREACDRGGREHADIDSRGKETRAVLEDLLRRERERDVQAESRRRVWSGAVSVAQVLFDYGPRVGGRALLLAGATFGGFKLWDMIFPPTAAPAALVERQEPPASNVIVSIPALTDGQGLRGRE